VLKQENELHGAAQSFKELQYGGHTKLIVGTK
jgi:hypothetical protein